ncbi:MAG: Holliday junction branch migration protein RuvA [Deltaproteobacteria bacterium]|nr:Holliday junction branch migration protein RuvA [Deltaproteobacteria bacterium]
MIGYLSGTTQYADIDAICINVGGVGYHVLMPLTDVARASKPGSKIEAYVHTHVREDALQLYGFSTRSGLSLFLRLLSVSGVGPRTALALLSGIEADLLVRTIAEGDEARLTKIPGVGKKTAQRILLELSEKMAKESLSSPLTSSPSSPASGKQRAVDDLRSALANLGYKTPQIDRALQKVKPLVDDGLDLSGLLREALKHVS